MFEAAVATIGLKPVLCLASESGPDEFPPQERLGALLPVGRLDDVELAARLRRVVALEAELAAYKTDLVTALTGRRPDALDLPEERPGAASPSWAPAQPPVLGGVSEFFADELALILNCSRSEATSLTDLAAMLHHHLPATRAALADGVLDWPRARAIAAELRLAVEATPPAILAAVEAAILPKAGGLSIPRLRDTVRREVLARDGLLAEARRRAAETLADVTTRPTRDGMAQVVADLPAPVAAAIRDTVNTYARLLKADGDPRPIGQLRALVLADLVLRPWDSSRPPVTAHLHLTAPVAALQPLAAGPGQPVPVGEVNGIPITYAQVRELLERLDALCPGGLRQPAGGSIAVDFNDERTGELRATADLSELRRLARRGCPDHPGHPDDPDDPDPGETGCACPAVEKPPPVDRYTPTPAQRRYLTARDRTCRMPGCANPVGDLDHTIPHAEDGPTSCENLCCLCRRHHRLKTHAKAGPSPSTPTAPCTSPHPAASPAPPDHPAGTCSPHNRHPTPTTTRRPSDRGGRSRCRHAAVAPCG